MAKLFRFSESLVKGNGKKWSQILKLLLIKGVKLPRKMFFGIGATIRIGQEMLCLPYAGFFLMFDGLPVHCSSLNYLSIIFSLNQPLGQMSLLVTTCVIS